MRPKFYSRPLGKPQSGANSSVSLNVPNKVAHKDRRLMGRLAEPVRIQTRRILAESPFD
jgi:hypothetical protein